MFNLNSVNGLVFQLRNGENKISEVMIRKELDDDINISTNTSPIVFNIYRAVVEDKAIKYVKISSISVESTNDFRNKIIEVFTYNNMKALAGKQEQLTEEDYKTLIMQLTGIINEADLGVYDEVEEELEMEDFEGDFGEDFGEDDTFTGDAEEIDDISDIEDDCDFLDCDFTDEEIEAMLNNTSL